jgi:hypothetical protein
MIISIIDKDGVTQATTSGILQTFVAFLQSKYELTPVDDACVTRKEKAGHRTLQLGWGDFLDTPITEEELKAEMSKSACKKAPGRDGIYLEFFNVNWDSIKYDMLALFNQMYLDGRIMEQLEARHCGLPT